MNMHALTKFTLSTPLSLVFQINKTVREFCRAGFISTAISEGIYDVLSKGPASCENIQNAMGTDFNTEGLLAWLDLGVSLGELKKHNKFELSQSYGELFARSSRTVEPFLLDSVDEIIPHLFLATSPK